MTRPSIFRFPFAAFILLTIACMGGKVPLYLVDTTGDVSSPATINFTTTVQLAATALAAHKETITTSNPTVTDDSDSGYSVGSRWMNTTSADIYICTDATVGAAVWTLITSSSGDVVGPAGGVVDGEIVLYSGTTGKIVKSSSGVVFPLTSSALATDSVAADEIATGAVGASELASGAVTTAAIAADAVTAAEIATDAVGSAEIATDAVGSDEVADNSLTASDLAADSVGASEIAADAVGSSEIAADAVGSSELASTAVTPGAYTNADITVDADGRITAASNGASAGEANTASNIGTADVGIFKQKTGVDLEFKKLDGVGPVSITDDVGNNEVDIDIVAGGIDATHLATDSVGSDEIAADAVGASEIAANAVGSSELAATSVSADTYTMGGGSFTVDADGRLTAATNGGRVGVYRTAWIPAGAFAPRATNGAAFTSEEYVTNDIQVDTALFDGATGEGVFAQIILDHWDEGTIKVKVYWDASAGASPADGVAWDISAGAIANDDVIDTALGTAQTVTDTVSAVGDLHITAASAAITVAGSPADGELVFIRVARDPANVSDTMTEDAKLIGILVQYLEDSTEEAAW